MFDDSLKLIYINYIGKNSEGNYEYELFFSETPDVVWGPNWEIACPSICGDLKPEEDTYSEVKHLISIEKLSCVQENSCFSMQDCIDGIIALFWNSDHTIVFHFGTPLSEVVDTFNSNNNYYFKD